MLDNGIREEIDSEFITGTRLRIIEILSESGELTQGQIKEKLDSSPAAVSNLLAKFNQYKHSLIKYRSAGKYRYYSLTELGREYIEASSNVRTVRDVGSVKESDLLREAKRCIEELKQIDRRLSSERETGGWGVDLEWALIWRVSGGTRRADSTVEEITDRLLLCCERMVLNNDEDSLSGILEFLNNPLLQDKIEEYLKLFDPFKDIISGLTVGDRDLDLCDTVMCAFRGGEPSPEMLSRAGLSEKEYAQLCKSVDTVKTIVSGYDEETVYHFIQILFMKCNHLGYALTRLICGK